MADNAEASGDAQLSFKVKTTGDGNHAITMAASATVLDLKTMLSREAYENIPVERQRLIYSGRVMKNDDTLATYKIKPGNTIHLVKSAASNPAPVASASTSAPAPQAVPANMAAGTSANNPLAGLTGARYAGQVPLPNQNLFGPDGGMNIPSEDQLLELLSNPTVAQNMREALDNPAFVDYMIQQNPMLRNIPNARQVLQSPYFRNMMTNPDALRMAAGMRRAMGGASQASAFPAPGQTDTTPAGAPSTAAPGAQGANANPAGAPPFGLAPLTPDMLAAMLGGNADGAANPAARMNQFASALFGNPGAAGAAATPGTTAAGSAAPGAAGTGAQGSAPAAGGDPAAAANPFAGLLGLFPQGGAGAPMVISPEMWNQALQGLAGDGGLGSPPPVDNRPPEERYAEQLRQLNDMGFYDFDQNVAALRRSGGSVQGAIQHLLGD